MNMALFIYYYLFHKISTQLNFTVKNNVICNCHFQKVKNMSCTSLNGFSSPAFKYRVCVCVCVMLVHVMDTGGACVGLPGTGAAVAAATARCRTLRGNVRISQFPKIPSTPATLHTGPYTLLFYMRVILYELYFYYII